MQNSGNLSDDLVVVVVVVVVMYATRCPETYAPFAPAGFWEGRTSSFEREPHSPVFAVLLHLRLRFAVAVETRGMSWVRSLQCRIWIATVHASGTVLIHTM